MCHWATKRSQTQAQINQEDLPYRERSLHIPKLVQTLETYHLNICTFLINNQSYIEQLKKDFTIKVLSAKVNHKIKNTSPTLTVRTDTKESSDNYRSTNDAYSY